MFSKTQNLINKIYVIKNIKIVTLCIPTFLIIFTLFLKSTTYYV